MLTTTETTISIASARRDERRAPAGGRSGYSAAPVMFAVIFAAELVEQRHQLRHHHHAPFPQLKVICRGVKVDSGRSGLVGPGHDPSFRCFSIVGRSCCKAIQP